jgi:transketolase
VDDGNDLDALEKALFAARQETRHPSMIAVRTQIGFGSPNKQNTASAHGEPLGGDELKLTKENLGWPLEPECLIPQQALEHFRGALKQGAEWEAQWAGLFAAYEEEYPDLSREWRQWMAGDLPEAWHREIPHFDPDPKGMATRAASGKVLNAVAPAIPNLIGGSSDLAPSNKTIIKEAEIFCKDRYDGRNFHFGVREHGMGSILNGMALHGGILPYGGTFLIFSDYMRPAIRLAAMMQLRIIYIFTHDSIGLGEDGPTHQPIEQLASLRAIPNLTVLRPCDANETTQAWRIALGSRSGPHALVLSRQGLPVLDRTRLAPADGVFRGSYILKGDPNELPDIILMSSGSEVHPALEAAERLGKKGVTARVVSMPSWELFEKQEGAYRLSVLPPQAPVRIAVEAGSTQGWHRYTGDGGAVIGLDHFGSSAPYKILYEKFGITAEKIVEKALELLEKT